MLTLSEHLKNTKDDMEAAIVRSWLDHYPYMDCFALKTLPGRTSSWRREETLGSVSKRSINEVFTESTGTTSQHSLTMEILGGLIDIDKELLDEPVYEDEAALQMSMKSRALGFTAANDIVNGDPSTNIEEFAGLKVLSTTLASRNVLDGGGLDMRSGAVREANADEIIRLLMLGIQRTKSGTGKLPSFMLVNDTFEQFLVDAIRRAGHFRVTDDTFDRALAIGAPWKFAGVPVYDAGFLADQSTKVISDTHDGNGFTSVYMVYSSDTTTRLVQKYGVRTQKIGLLPTGSHVRWLAEWCWALQMRDKFSVVRNKGFQIV